MGRVEDFDAFYYATRRTLLHQTYTAVPDANRAARAVEQAYASAWRHWRKVDSLDDPASWVRAHVERAEAAGTTPAGSPGARTDDLDDVPLMRSAGIRRAGVRQRHRHALLGVLTAVVLAVGAGFLIVNDDTGPAPRAADPRGGGSTLGPTTPPELPPRTTTPSAQTSPTVEVGVDQLLKVAALRVLEGNRVWAAETAERAAAAAPYTVCQRHTLADPRAEQAVLRRFRVVEGPRAAVVQVLEESQDARAASRGFRRMHSWFATCQDPGIQLMRTYQVTGLGEQAGLVRLRRGGTRGTHLTAVVTRTGRVTTGLITSSPAPDAFAGGAVAKRLAVSVDQLCNLGEKKGGCGSQPQLIEVAPVPLSDSGGFLGALDLPPVPDIDAPWVATEPRRGSDGLAADPCDVDLSQTSRPRVRVFVLATAAQQQPRRFGLSETIGLLPSPRVADRFLDRAHRNLATCPDRELGTTVERGGRLRRGPVQASYWRLSLDLGDGQAVVYRTGLVRRGRAVAQVSMSPSPRYDVTGRDFTALLVRAGQRLAAVPS